MNSGFVERCAIKTHLVTFKRLNAVREVAIWENPTGRNKPENIAVILRVSVGSDGVKVQCNMNTHSEDTVK